MYGIILTALISICPTSNTMEVPFDATIVHGDDAWGVLNGSWFPVEPELSVESEQTLRTTVQDPNNPDEPWIVTSYRRQGESIQSFIRRHDEMVDSVRDALGGKLTYDTRRLDKATEFTPSGEGDEPTFFRFLLPRYQYNRAG